MDIAVRWLAPVRIRAARRGEPLIYACDHLDRLPEDHGWYVFGRRFGDNVEPIYIGKASDLRRRIEQHLLRNVPLLRAIQDRPKGERVVLVGKWIARPGQQEARVLEIVERALIKKALALGFDIVNVHGTRTPVHNLSMSGAHVAVARLFGRDVKIEA